MGTELRRIGEKARKDPRLVFTSWYHHICDVDNLRACFEALPGDRAVGIDGVTKERYGENLEPNLQDLSARLREMMDALPVRRHAGAGRSRSNSLLWALPTTPARPSGAHSSSSAAPAARNSRSACAPSVIGRAGHGIR